MRRGWMIFGLALSAWLAGAFSRAADTPTEATVTDIEGKTHKVAALKFGIGARRLAWMANATGTTEDEKKGPLALELRELLSTTYAKGIVTYVPVGSVDSIKYDYEKQLATVAVKGLTEPLTGTLQYKGINVLNFDGTVDGKNTKYSGGSFAKDHIKAVEFAGAKAIPTKKAAATWLVQIDHAKAENPTLKCSNFKFLYVFPGGVEVALDAAPLRKGDPLKLDDTVKQLAVVAVDQNTHVTVVEVLIGDTEKLLVIPHDLEKDGKKGMLLGLLCEADAGWKLFPTHTIKTMKRPKKD